jgi:hypothetical protein
VDEMSTSWKEIRLVITLIHKNMKKRNILAVLMAIVTLTAAAQENKYTLKADITSLGFRTSATWTATLTSTTVAAA